MSQCSNPACRSPDARMAAKGLCWNCYQGQRREGLPKKRVPPCINGRRYHTYDATDRCKYCGAVRVFNV